MTEYFGVWLILASVNLAATLSPGPAFILTVRNALSYNRPLGMMTAMGLGLGIGVHVAFVLGGIAVVIAKSVILFNLIKYAGAAYLVFIGAKAVLAKKSDNANPNIQTAQKPLTAFGALRMGFLTNVLNPKAVVFFTAVYAQFITVDTPPQILVLFGLTSVLIEAIWFSIVTFILTNPRIKNAFLGISHWIERVCGGLLIALGIRLALSKGLT
jgi:RhtB (resistance to homoserine/threonine) family protein